MRFAIIDAEKATYRVTILCKALNVTRSGFYAWLGRGKSSRERTNEELSSHIVSIHKESRCTYGCPRIQAELTSKGHRVSRKRVARLMLKQGIRAQTQALGAQNDRLQPSVPRCSQPAGARLRADGA